LLDFSVNGRYLAYHLAAVGDENYDGFRSVDARTGEVVRDSGRVERRGVGIPHALALTDTGAIAWLHDSVLYATDANGTRTLATPDGGEISAPAARGRTVFWTQGGVPHSTVLR
jgi:hypothetical protein